MIQSAVEEGCFHKTQLILVASCPLSLFLALLPLITSDSLTPRMLTLWRFLLSFPAKHTLGTKT